ncbi:MAG: hypothetical protein NPIRA02_36100 [Nitrospirales bacterium]|nr:MAG: hypothetical protein NPIRA02_36100 [Nitrospirales bacterium]
MGLPCYSSKYILTILLLVVLWSIPSSLSAEIWSYACAEAMTLLSQAQHDVVQQHNRVYQAKLTLKLFPDGLETCRNGNRGFAGGTIHCVTHRSHGGVAIKEVIQAQRMLEQATQTFARRLKGMTRACSLSE